MWYIYTMEYYAAIKRNEILPFVMMWIELESIMLSEVSQSENDNYYMISDIRNLRGKVGVMGVEREKMKQDGVRKETNYKRLLIS